MAPSPDRYMRQRRLADVGDLGQARISAAEFEVQGSDGAMEEVAYLCRAGAERVGVRPAAEPRPFAHEQAFRFAEPRRVAAGAWRALGQLVRALRAEGA